jgi:hypothetical protein
MTLSVVLFIAFVAWGLVIPGAVVGLRLRRAAAAERGPAPPRACERRARPAATRRAVTRAH